MNNRTVSLLSQNSIGKYGIQDSEKAAVGTPLKIVDFDDIITTCRNPKTKSDKKHQCGAIYAYKQDTLGVREDSVSGGMIFCDIDNISKEVAKDIYEHFDDISSKLQFLYACAYSSSYTISKDHAGLHFFCYSDELTKNEYSKYAKVCLFTIARTIELVLGYKLVTEPTCRVDKNKPIVDTHNCSIAQKLYLFYDPFKINDSAWPITPGQYDDFAGQLEEIYPQFFKKEESVAVSLNNNVEISGKCEKKIELHYGQDYTIANYLVATGKYSKDEVLSILLSIESRPGNQMKSNGEKTIESHFRQIVSTAFTKYGGGVSVPSETKIKAEKLLNQVGFTVVNCTAQANAIEIASDKFLSDEPYYHQLFDFYKQHNKIQVVSGTGTGKTVASRERLAVDLNAILIYPYNALSELYKYKERDGKLSGLQLYMPKLTGFEKYTDKQPICMVYDQFVMLCKEGKIDKNRPVIVDESHCLFFEQGQGFREACVRCMRYLMDFTHVILISATPCCELQCIGVNDYKENTITFFKKRKPVNFTFCYEKPIIKRYEPMGDILNIMVNTACYYSEHKKYDHILVLTDSMYEVAKDNMIFKLTDDKITHFRSEDREKPEIVDLLNNEIVKKDILITTKVGNNALNYANKDEKFLILLDFAERETAIQEIVQKIGRVRFSEVDCMCFLRKTPDKMSVTKKHTYNEIKKLYSGRIAERLLHIDDSLSDEQVFQAALEVEQYIEKESTVDNLFDYLNDTGYINIFEREYPSSHTKDENGNKKKIYRYDKIKKAASDTFKTYLKNDMLDELHDSENEFINKWYKDIKDILKEECYNIDKEHLYEFILSQKQENLMSTILNTFFDVYICCVDTDEQFADQLKQIDDFIAVLNKNNLGRSVKDWVSKKKKFQQYRSKYKGIFEEGAFSSVLSFMIEEIGIDIENTRAKISEAKKKPIRLRNIHSKKILKFDSIESCAEFFGVSGFSLRKFIKGDEKIRAFKDYKYINAVSQSVCDK